MSTRADTDVAIIGGGPAGASMAAYLAKAGIKCTVFESDLFPRPHVGESLVPSSTRVFKDLDFLPTMEELGFPHKLGAASRMRAERRISFDQDRLSRHNSVASSPGCRRRRLTRRDEAGV